MKKEGAFSGTWHSGKQNITMNLPVIIFEEDNATIMYCPALDVSGYGKNEEEAKESFNVSLGEFFLYTTRKKTLSTILLEMGWTIKSKHKPFIPPSMGQLLDSNENFNRIFNNFPFKKIHQDVTMPC